jgi:hypothetical protein
MQLLDTSEEDTLFKLRNSRIVVSTFRSLSEHFQFVSAAEKVPSLGCAEGQRQYHRKTLGMIVVNNKTGIN